MTDDERIKYINTTMETYLTDGTLKQAVADGYVLVERTTESGVRLGIVGLIDLDDYDFDPKKKTLIRATEGTVISRIPPRVKIRENAAIELPHVMLLVDDPIDRQRLMDARCYTGRCSKYSSCKAWNNRVCVCHQEAWEGVCIRHKALRWF